MRPKYILNHKVLIWTQEIKGKQRVLQRVPTIPESCQLIEAEIIAIHPDEDPMYMLMIPKEVIGWQVSASQIAMYEVNAKHLGKIFYDLPERFIVGKA